MPVILVADDSEIDRKIIVDVLQKEPLDWLVEVVGSAEEAMKLMREIAFDVVITDVLMEGLSGIDLLNHVHRQPRRVPVIVISGQDNGSAAVEALRQGAASYVPKSCLAALLGETVRQVLDSSTSKENYQALISTAEDMRFNFKLPNDLALIHPMIGMIQRMASGMQVLDSDACTRLGIAVDEAVSNAMLHGNLELSDDAMDYIRSHLHDHEPLEPVETRRSEKPYCDRYVHVGCLITKEGIKLAVRDDGKGFALASAEQAGVKRGLTLIQNLVDKAAYNEAGNEITLLKRASAQKPAQLEAAT